MFKLDLEKAEEPEIKFPTFFRSSEKQGNQNKQTKQNYFCFIFYAKPFDCVDENKLWKILQEMGTPHHLSCLLCGGQEAIGRARHGTTDWFQIGKGVRQGCTFSLCLFNLYAEYTS